MSYKAFQLHVCALIRRMGGGIGVKFSNQNYARYFANFSDGTVIVGNPTSTKVAVRWGGSPRNHQAVFDMAQ